MPRNLAPRVPLYQQVTDALAADIDNDVYAPGDQVPSESQIAEMFGVSQVTARHALRRLAQMGLTVSQQGRRAIVRHQSTPSVEFERAIYRTGRSFITGEQPSEVEAPTVTRVHLTGLPSELLGLDEPQVFQVDRLLEDEATGARISHRVMIPLETATEVRELHDEPDAAPAHLYGALAAAGYSLEWAETVSVRIPMPDERTALRMLDTASLLITHRVTVDADSGRPLMLEELHASSETTRLTFRITATRPSKAASRR